MDLTTLRTFRSDSRIMVRELGFLQDAWAPAGIAHAQCHLLLELSESGQLRPSELSDRLRSDPAVISRGLKALAKKGLVDATPDPTDKRQRIFTLTPSGQVVVRGIHEDADSQVRQALDVLNPTERDQVFAGMRAYAKALRRSRLQADVVIRPIRPSDDPAITALIRKVMPEFGANGPGFALHDPEVQAMYEAYQAPRSSYFVVERDGVVLGGGGYAPLEGGEAGVCELRKMYFQPELRGVGVGAKLLQTILDAATAEGFRVCYLETLEHMSRARRLYESFGFEKLDRPMGETGHHGCNSWYAKSLV